MKDQCSFCGATRKSFEEMNCKYCGKVFESTMSFDGMQKEIEGVLMAHKEINRVSSQIYYNPSSFSWFKFTKWMMLTVVLGLFVFEVATNIFFRQLISQNIFFISLSVIFGVTTIYAVNHVFGGNKFDSSE